VLQNLGRARRTFPQAEKLIQEAASDTDNDVKKAAKELLEGN
jgi:hypothetical protein